jgi:hypothetical protein
MNGPIHSRRTLPSPPHSFSFRLLLAAESFRFIDHDAAAVPADEFPGDEPLADEFPAELGPEVDRQRELEAPPSASAALLTLSVAIQSLTRVLTEVPLMREPDPATIGPSLKEPTTVGAAALPSEPRPLAPPVPDPVALISTKAAARHLRVRPSRLFALCEEALADGVARRTGTGTQRQHVRWRLDRIDTWWRSRSD